MNGEVELSARLKALADMVTAGNRVCDVGCDHGFLPVYLVQKGICPSAVAMDLRDGPLSRAREHIEERGLTELIHTRRSDGVAALDSGEAETLICAGMGGRLIRRILAEGREKCRAMRELILQPQSEVMQVRQFLREERYRILAEDMVLEDGKYYFLIKAEPAEEARAENPLFDRFGECLLREGHPLLRRYLLQEKKVTEEILARLSAPEARAGTAAAGRYEVLSGELMWIEKALEWNGG